MCDTWHDKKGYEIKCFSRADRLDTRGSTKEK